MCGIVGFWQTPEKNADALTGMVRQMADAIAYRGPDDFGEWVDDRFGIALGNRRLAILDLSPHGRQPMISDSGRYVITYNGETYNYDILRRELESRAHRFRGHSDTEVILAAVEEWGVWEAVRRFNGMFAMAIWDRTEAQLHLIRDRLGIKPLYVYQFKDRLLFGSELKTFKAHPDFQGDLNTGVLSSFLRYRYVPAPSTIYAHARKLPPGHLLTVKDCRASLPPSQAYWSAAEVAQAGIDDPLVGEDNYLTAEADELLRDAVRIHMASDVPLGVFLSGGVDSSTVTALMQAQSSDRIKTFSIGFESSAYNEAEFAAAVAKHLQTDHTELYLTSEDVLAVIPMLGEMFDEPFADASQIPTYLVSRLARQQVIVALSGDGGDEVFGGYNRYLWVPKIWKRGRRMPALSHKVLDAAVQALSPDMLNRFYERLQQHLPRSLHVRLFGDKLHKLAMAGGATSADELYRSVASAYAEPEKLLQTTPNGSNGTDHLLSIMEANSCTDPIHRMMLADLVTYLPDDILTKVDRCSMSVSLESRVPLLDYRVVEFGWRLPQRAKVRDGIGKWLLRQVLYNYVPPSLIERPKSGFDLPIDAWLRGPLSEWASDLLSPERLRREGLFDATAVEKLLAEHQSHKRNWRDILWAILMFEVWRDRWAS
jgi:asparagine synthase (glutamine-hydrolysing)